MGHRGSMSSVPILHLEGKMTYEESVSFLREVGHYKAAFQLERLQKHILILYKARQNYKVIIEKLHSWRAAILGSAAL
jgi:hypothetical protein